MDEPAAALLSNQIKRQDFFWSRNAGRQPGEKATLKGGAWPPGQPELHLPAREAPKAPLSTSRSNSHDPGTTTTLPLTANSGTHGFWTTTALLFTLPTLTGYGGVLKRSLWVATMPLQDGTQLRG